MTKTTWTVAAGVAGILAVAASAWAAETCFYQNEVTSGMNKICYYSCVSGTAAITLSSVTLCPLSIKR